MNSTLSISSSSRAIGANATSHLRPRRLRSSAGIRALVAETRLAVEDFIYPLFVHDLPDDAPVSSMPGVVRHALDSLLRECEAAVRVGIRAVAIFPVVEAEKKDAMGAEALNESGVLYRAIVAVKREFPDLLVMADVALDPFTTHGHDGILSADGRTVLNDKTVAILARMAVLEARAGADIVAPSDMMDGRVAALRIALDEAKYTETLILSYAAKYASAYYGPFRDAVGSKIGVDAISKATYQMDPANAREALREARLDEIEGADIVMVKPAGPYLDVVAAVSRQSAVPVAAYQVSGEYAQIHAAARAGWLDYERTRDESLLGIKRAGAAIILSYFAKEVAEALVFSSK